MILTCWLNKNNPVFIWFHSIKGEYHNFQLFGLESFCLRNWWRKTKKEKKITKNSQKLIFHDWNSYSILVTPTNKLSIVLVSPKITFFSVLVSLTIKLYSVSSQIFYSVSVSPTTTLVGPGMAGRIGGY